MHKTKIAFLTTYPPRQCGIATFAKSYIEVIDDLNLSEKPKVLAISDEVGSYDYSRRRVIFEIDQFDRNSYLEAAKFVNHSDLDIVSLQHEFGIYGGDHGEYVLDFLERVRRPVITNFHSVASKKLQNDKINWITSRIIEESDTLVVMTNNARKILYTEFSCPWKKIKVIPHGVPDVLLSEKNIAKEKFGLDQEIVFGTFGLINPGKGIELALGALAQIKPDFPNFKYLIIGATHPAIRKKSGEEYRQRLKDLAKKLGIRKNVVFVNEYLPYHRLVEYLKSTDIYLAPQLDLKQAFSGTISYAMGCGCVVISSPTNYAKEILANGRGIIVFPDEKSIGLEIKKILQSKSKFKKIQYLSYRFAREMIWEKVGKKFLLAAVNTARFDGRNWQKYLPDFESEEPSLRYLHFLTDKIGIIQHTKGSLPDLAFGYSIDDQARALMVCAKYLKEFPHSPDGVKKLLKTYLLFLWKAIDDQGKIHNFLDIKGRYLDEIGSDDSQARSFWAISFLSSVRFLDKEIRELVFILLARYKKALSQADYPKSIAYRLLGYANIREKKMVVFLANSLISKFDKISQTYRRWRWFEKEITYANAIIPLALLKAYRLTGIRKYYVVALDALTFLEKSYHHNNKTPAPVGQAGWYAASRKKALFDQQPLEAGDMVMLYNELYELTEKEIYRQKANAWMGWYFGNNIKKRIIFNHKSHSIHDGLTEAGINPNQGAESTVTYLLAYLSFRGGI